MVPNYSEEEATQPMLLERVLPSPGLLRMKKIRLWVATIIVLTVVGALFLLTSSKIHSQSKAYMSWQYKVKDTKVGAHLLNSSSLAISSNKIKMIQPTIRTFNGRTQKMNLIKILMESLRMKKMLGSILLL